MEDEYLQYQTLTGYNSTFFTSSSGGNYKRVLTGDFKLPATFITVINKMIPEILEVSVKKVEIYNPSMIGSTSINTFTYDSYGNYNPPVNHSFFVTLDLLVERKNLENEYNRKIEELFVLTYPDYNFVHFDVNLRIKSEPTNLEKFYELFG